MINKLKEARLKNNYTQEEASKFLKVSLRSYKTYEKDDSKRNTLKYKYLTDTLNKNAFIDEEHGILSVNNIIEGVKKVFKDYDIDYCYLFGSYAKGKQKEDSDVDLLISSTVNGIKFYGLVEDLRSELNKKVDLLNTKQLINNQGLLNEILKYGIKIYGENKR